ncbi:MAG: DHA2 family efflux MFS transporter permease subunit [Gammaproteobacteria bacterium]|nr:MAG: DHA2 family efflux MFS transporter permease subunit [Gammaproteobacteria bacterium]
MKPISLFALCLGFFMVIMDVTIINVALPTLAIDLHTTVSWLQWIVDGYTLSFAGLLLTAGHLSDQFNTKTLFRLGVIIFALTSLVCGLVSSPLLLTTFRLLQGIAAAIIVPTSLALIHIGFSEQTARSKAIAIWATTGGIAAAMGPVTGAILTSALSWRAVFFVNVPIALICLWLTKKDIKVKDQRILKSFDWPGQAFAILSIATLALAIIEAGHLGWKAPLVMASFVIFSFSTLIFIAIETRSKAPMLPLTFFAVPTFTIGIICGLLLNFGVYGEFFILPLYFQHLRGYSTLITGLALTPLTIIMPIASYLSGRLIHRIGVKWTALFGLLLATIGFLCLLIAGEHSPAYYYFILPLLIVGLGVPMAMPALTVIVMHSVTSDSVGLASGAFNASRQLGSLLGVALFGSIIASTPRFIVGMHITLYIGIATYLLAVFLMGSLLRKGAGEKRQVTAALVKQN